MTVTDLKLEYKNLSGKYPPNYNIPDLPDAKTKWHEDMEDYIEWLETSLVDAHNKGSIKT